MKGAAGAKNLLGAASALMMAAFLGLVLWSYHEVFSLDQIGLYSENGLLENIQAALLAIACLTFLVPVIFEKRPDKPILLFFSLVCYAFALRELDVENLDVPEIFKTLGSGSGRNISIAAALALIVSFSLFDFAHYKHQAFCFLKSISGALMLMGASFLFVGDFFEKTASIQHHVYFEEIAELLADVFIVLGALSVHSVFKQKIHLV